MEEENEMYESGSYQEKWNENEMEDLDWSEEDRWLSRTRWKEKMKSDAERNSYVPNVNVSLMEKWKPLVNGKERKKIKFKEEVNELKKLQDKGKESFLSKGDFVKKTLDKKSRSQLKKESTFSTIHLLLKIHVQALGLY
jgi:hypothetical protein